MADSSKPAADAAAGASKPQAAPKPPNPVFKMMGLPNFRLKLPSRNWMIFLTITGSFTGALIYDRREKRRAQQKWSELVAHLAKEPLAVDQMRRKLTVYLAAPPGDGLRIARDHFKEYVKPILTAAALDYNVIEGRREGDVRAGTAEQIRKIRIKAGEKTSVVEEPSVETAVLDMREKLGVSDEAGPKGDLVIGRHTWKEYVRGLHEGWLGPLDPPAAPVEEVPSNGIEEPMKDIATGDKPEETPNSKTDEIKSQVTKLEDIKIEETNTEETKAEKEEEKEKPAKPTGPKDAFITTAEYPRCSTSSHSPSVFRQLYRNRRHLAESIGRDVAGIVLASAARPYSDENPSGDLLGTPSSDNSPIDSSSGTFEQQTILEKEEQEWHKSVHKRDETDKERVWLDNIVLDPRIASRMKHSLLSAEDEARSERLAEQKEYILGEERPAPVPFWRRMWINYGYGEDDETIRRKPILGNIDDEETA
ncbi:hypothetical protein N7450_003166 [Penicillium hetheringtonii]|uniref:Mitochondrial import inner membrane translocase subunit TIM54 n=1 Tax=Penicillium hetheringtonii TaxID=911720 RepID=A0AAD6GXZ5_9EURO|nr:hypothetical protein N7450_003166 [Penicillium hetheringtonii]